MRQLQTIIVAIALLAAASANAVTPKEIMTLAKIGVAADEMIKAIERDKTIFRLSVSQILELKKSGVPDKVLKYMLKTPQLYGKKKKGTTGGGVQTAPTAATPEEMTPAERAALEAKQRAEAQRLADEALKAATAQRRAFAQGILKKGMDLAKSGDYVPSIVTFLDFIAKGGYTRGTDEHYTAWYGIAHALSKAGLYQAAARYLVDVLLEGPDKPFFQKAFWALRTIRKKINYSPPDLEDLTKMAVVSFSRRFQDEYNYFLGEFFYENTLYARAMTYFEQVSDDAPDSAKAIYLTGLVQVQNQLYKSAVQSFQNAVTATERNRSDKEVADLAYLALARIAYEAENFDAAIYYYRKIPPKSNKIPTAFYESAWTYFVKGDYSRALGTFQALHSPFFKHYFYPELWILEATIYVNLCRYDLAKKSIEQFNKRVNALAIPLKNMLRKLRSPQDYWRAFVGISEKRKGYAVDRRVVHPVLADVVFYNLFKTVRQIEWEEKEIRKVQNKLGGFGTDLMAKLGDLRQSSVNAAGIRVQQVMKTLESELEDYAVKVTEIEVDLSVVEIETKTRELQGINEPAKEKGETEAEGARAIVGSDSMSWGFEGEYWRDAIGGFRSFLKSACF